MSDEDEIAGYRMPGRPPKKPKNRVGHPVRCLTTKGVNQMLDQAAADVGLTLSNYFRLALYNQLVKDGKLTADLKKDATWDDLKTQGFV